MLNPLNSSLSQPLSAVIGTWVMMTAPAMALEMRVSPEQPRLGETLSVLIESDAEQAPTLTARGRRYETFAVGRNRYRAFIPTTPLDTPGPFAIEAQSGDQRQRVNVPLGDRNFTIQEIWLSPSVNAITGTDYEFDRMDDLKATVTPERLWTGPFIHPSDGPITTPYGVRRYYNGVWADNYYHRGLDYAAPTGAPVVAAARGRVALVGTVSQGFELHGNSVGIDHGQGVTTIYIHLSQIEVQEGQMVDAGEVIGRIGSTGISTGPHLHWGLYVNGECVDPAPWLGLGLK
ncbi:M23 family metallopeptidase [Geitlerinema sp. P-1104]|uniref:M23 family metallopeptidase n=1 Tax=Geitlerinema sp. P-1104 TaxID=2546230 RepID=UPI0014776DFD|nr:M23 family metallopeptidase [Geitlerinema sp. P-1104]NMG58979.1 M23 family metallopeptidase [Geitlerinema sp. P-1104]